MQTYPVELQAPDIAPYKAGNTGIDYATTFDSGRPGPHVMVNGLMHGNEICGAIALDYLFRNDIRPVSGKLSLVFVNVEAYLRFDPNSPFESRYVDEDLNRLWIEQRLDGDETTVELSRARALRPLFDRADFLLDLHSMGTNSPALTICNGLPKERALAAAVGYPKYTTCGSGHVIGNRLIEYTPFRDTGNDKTALLVECGQHWARDTGTTALDTAMRFLLATGIVRQDIAADHISVDPPPQREVFEVVDGVTARTDDFRFVESYQGMETIPHAGTVIAYDGETPVRTPFDDCVLMMPNHRAGRGMRVLRLCRRSA